MTLGHTLHLTCQYSVPEDSRDLLLDYLSGGGAGWRASELTVLKSDASSDQIEASLTLKGFDGSWSSVFCAVAGMIPFMPSSTRIIDIDLKGDSAEILIPAAKYRSPNLFEILGLSRQRPLLFGILKPGWLSPDDAATLAVELFMSGCDAIKDDELAIDRDTALARMKCVTSALKQAQEEAGRPCLYVSRLATIPRDPNYILQISNDVKVGIMCVPFLDGFDFLRELRLRLPNVLIASHPAAISPLFEQSLAIAKMPRLVGADMLICPAPFGKLRYPECVSKSTLNYANHSMYGLPPSTCVFGGGVTAIVARQLKSSFGDLVNVAVGAALATRSAPLQETVKHIYSALKSN